jgi:hypothetical protein
LASIPGLHKGLKIPAQTKHTKNSKHNIAEENITGKEDIFFKRAKGQKQIKK